jgi:hypothetical protein
VRRILLVVAVALVGSMGVVTAAVAGDRGPAAPAAPLALPVSLGYGPGGGTTSRALASREDLRSAPAPQVSGAALWLLKKPLAGKPVQGFLFFGSEPTVVIL